MNYFYKQPKYMNDFYCIGGECPETCCAKWRIDWTASEVEKILNSNCSDELKEKAKNFFLVVDEEKRALQIRILSNGRCPFLTEDNLCCIQKELGEEYLSYTCKTYPRNITLMNNYFLKACSANCYKVVDLLCSDSESMKMEVKKVNQKNIKCKIFTDDEIKKRPEILHMKEILDFFMEILNDERCTIETSIVMGALAAKKLSELIENGHYDDIPDIIKKLKPQTSDIQQIDNIEKIKPNYNYSIGVVNEILAKVYGREIMKLLYTEGKPDVEKFICGRNKFLKAFEKNSFAERNIIKNLFLELFSFKYDLNYTLYENYLFFAFSASAIKLAGMAMGYATNNIYDEYKHYISLYMRKLDSNSTVIGDVLDYMKENKCDTPAYIALMLKT